MLWSKAIILLGLLSVGGAMNKPVYKIILTQKGFAQFLQYDIEIPPLREFTFCAWIRIYEFNDDQSIFTYVVNGDNRVIRLWLSKNERSHVLKVSVHERVSASVPVNIERDSWRHVCLSYQSDHGAWALYLDSKLINCESARSLQGYVVPGSGSIILGYGTTSDNDGSPKGLEGEIFGANMIISSTIERNHTLKMYPEYEQKSFERNKIKNTKNIEYIVLKDLNLDETTKNTNNLPSDHTRDNHVKVKTAYNFFEHDVGVTLRPRKTKQVDVSNQKENRDNEDHTAYFKEKRKEEFWNMVNEAGRAGTFKIKSNNNREQFQSGTQELSTISEYETPPSPGTPNHEYAEKNLEIQKPPVSESIFRMNEETTRSTEVNNKKNLELSEIEVPPPRVNNQKVYGQWTSSKFAGSVLNYLKNNNFQTKERKVPQTIPLNKYSDQFPYASEIKIKTIKPSFTMRRKNIIIEKRKYNQNSYLQNNMKRLHLTKRSIRQPQRNIEIVKDNFRQHVMKTHAQTKPENVEVTNRGDANRNRYSRNIDHKIEPVQIKQTNSVLKDRLFNRASNLLNHKLWENFDVPRSNSLINALPFLKSVEYFTEESSSEKVLNDNAVYTKTLAKKNKWHNVKSFSNDYTPRRIYTMENEDDNTSLSQSKIRIPSIKLKYKPESHAVVANMDDKNIIKGRELALEVSNQSDYNKDMVSILKYNHGYLPGYSDKKTISKNSPDSKSESHNNFNKPVKIGNALNERYIIGSNDEQRKKSFLGGNENVPDIQKYRSDLDKESDVSTTQGTQRVCKTAQLFDPLLYVQPDESIDISHIFSPIKQENIGISFIIQNYKTCSLENTALEHNNLLLLNWNKTPVRLFGGAKARKTKDLCGFF